MFEKEYFERVHLIPGIVHRGGFEPLDTPATKTPLATLIEYRKQLFLNCTNKKNSKDTTAIS